MHAIYLFVYQIILGLALLIVGPFLAFRTKTRSTIKEKLGFLPRRISNYVRGAQEIVWVHAVSVGEFNAIASFVRAFKTAHPQSKIVISTTTATGNKLARERTSDFAEVFYFPFDLAWIVNHVISVIKPSLVVIVETELWPYFVSECYRRAIPLTVLNGRMSPRSAKRYERLKFFFGPTVRKFSLLGVQSEEEARRYRLIGGDRLPIEVFGNLKYDNFSSISPGELASLRERTGITPDHLVLVAGSTHEGEETVVLNVLKRARPMLPAERLRLVIAPRHPERFERVIDIVTSAGYRARLYSKSETLQSDNDVLIIDTIGALAKIYSLGKVAFVGGTLAKIGGHNLLEPYAYGVPASCGPHLFKTQDSASLLVESGALVIGRTGSEVESFLLELLQNRELRFTRGQIGKQWLVKNSGAESRALNALNRFVRTSPAIMETQNRLTTTSGITP